MARLSSKLDKDQKLVRLGAAIRARRKTLGVSQEGLAIASGIERSNMGKIERGENNLSVLNLVRIANALDGNAAGIFSDAGL